MGFRKWNFALFITTPNATEWSFSRCTTYIFLFMSDFQLYLPISKPWLKFHIQSQVSGLNWRNLQDPKIYQLGVFTVTENNTVLLATGSNQKEGIKKLPELPDYNVNQEIGVKQNIQVFKYLKTQVGCQCCYWVHYILWLEPLF